jgi:hypothetical protein
MNEQIKDAIKKSGFSITPDGLWEANYTSVEYFAKLVEAAAIAREREECAKLCEDINKTFGVGFIVVDHCAAAIRGRTDPKSAFKDQMDDNWSGII